MILSLEEHCPPAEALMDRVLRGGASIAREYPLLFDQRFDGRLVALHEEDEIASTCGILVREFVAGDARIKGGLIGSVATAETRRGRGFATRLLIEAEARLQLEGCGFVVLWANDAEFYLKRGYGPIGREIDLVLPVELLRGLETADGVREMQPDDAADVHALYAANAERVERSADETAALLDCPEMHKLVIERDGAVVAYACLGRGGDLAGTIHEWGGADADVLALVRAITDALLPEDAVLQGDEALFLIAPPSATTLIAELRSRGALVHESMLGLGKILDRAEAARVLDQLVGPEGSVEIVDSETREHFRLRGPEREVLLDDEGALALLLGVAEVGEDVAHFLEQVGLAGAPLPIDAFAWGLDSI